MFSKFIDWMGTMKLKRRAARDIRVKREIRGCITLRMSENADAIYLVVRGVDGEIAVRKFEDGESVSDIKIAAKRMKSIAAESYTPL